MAPGAADDEQAVARDARALKQAVHDYWDAAVCGTGVATAPRYSRAYFEQIEQARYLLEPQVHALARFPSAHGKRVLEIGVGAGTDFLQWVRSGARVWGIDLTESAVEHTRLRLAAYGLAPAGLSMADAEALPFPDGVFDLVYSWGVLHHTPDTERAMLEAVRVLRAGGEARLMLYNRRSVFAWRRWVRYGLLRGRPWRSVAWCLANHLESPGTQAYTAKEVRTMLARLPVGEVSVTPMLTAYDTLWGRSRFWRRASSLVAATGAGSRARWFMGVGFVKRQTVP